jgi:hypothetical protein
MDMKDRVDRVETLKDRVDRVETLAEDMFMIFDYTDENASVTTQPEFKRSLIALYSNQQKAWNEGRVFCMITQKYLPKPVVIAAHIWKRAWHMVCRKYMEFDVNDSRNGLLLFKPFEWAFDNSKICFIPDEFGLGEAGNFVMHILDGGIREVGIVDKLEEIEAQRRIDRGQSYEVRP